VRQGAVTPEAARRVHRTIVESLDGSPYQRVELTRSFTVVRSTSF